MAFFLVPGLIIWTVLIIKGIFGPQIEYGEFDFGATLMGIPHFIATIVIAIFTAMTIWGKVEITTNKMGGSIFTGIGSFGYLKRFKWRNINYIKEKQTNIRYPGSQEVSIVLEGKNRVVFATSVNGTRRDYLINALQILKENNYG